MLLRLKKPCQISFLIINIKLDKSDSFWTVGFTAYNTGCPMKASVEAVNACEQIIKE